jgi:hypothetical protein
MSKADIPENINFTGGKRGRYAVRYASGTNVVLLDPDVAARFRTADQVNRVLRSMIEVSAELATPRQSAMSLRRRTVPKRKSRS